MLKGGLTCVIGILSLVAKAQDSDHFIIRNQTDFEKVSFSLNTSKVNCYIEPSSNDDIINFYSVKHNPPPQLKEKTVDGVKMINVLLGEHQIDYLTSTISNKIFNSEDHSNDYNCKVLFSNEKPLDLYLNYAVGAANIDLSGLPIEHLAINTGSADVHINYNDNLPNTVVMDSMLINVDWGTITTNNLFLARAKQIIAEVGFGNMSMDFQSALNYHGNVTASVGAGRLEILLPQLELPIIVHLNDSPLCHVALPENFRKAGKNVYISSNYREGDNNAINFNLDVALGKIIFVANP